MEEKILVVNNLVKKYDKFALDSISFSIPRGYIMGFVGQNGAGKSTTIKCIMNLIEYESGSIELIGRGSTNSSHEIREHVGYVSEEQYFYENMTVKWTADFVGSFYKTWDEKYFYNLLDKFGVDRNKKISQLSKGMKMKLSLSLAMGHRPEFLILDEPTSGLDPIIRSELLEIFLDIIQDERRSILFSSHITTDIEKVADFVTIIDKGKIILTGEKHLILDEWKVVKAENKYLNENTIKLLKGIKKGDFGFSGITNNYNTLKDSFYRYYPDGNLQAERINLDELLLRLVKDGDNKCSN